VNRFLSKNKKKLKETSFMRTEKTVHCPATRRPGKHLENQLDPVCRLMLSWGEQAKEGGENRKLPGLLSDNQAAPLC